RLPEPAYPARAGHPLLCRAQKRPHENAAIRLGRPPHPNPSPPPRGRGEYLSFPLAPRGERGWGEGVGKQKSRWRLVPPPRRHRLSYEIAIENLKQILERFAVFPGNPGGPAVRVADLRRRINAQTLVKRGKHIADPALIMGDGGAVLVGGT